MKSSIKFEISILYTAILGLILIVFSGVLYLISNAFLQQINEQNIGQLWLGRHRARPPISVSAKQGLQCTTRHTNRPPASF